MPEAMIQRLDQISATAKPEKDYHYHIKRGKHRYCKDH